MLSSFCTCVAIKMAWWSKPTSWNNSMAIGKNGRKWAERRDIVTQQTSLGYHGQAAVMTSLWTLKIAAIIYLTKVQCWCSIDAF